MKTYENLFRWLLLRIRTFQIRRENQNTHLTFRNVFRKPCRLWDNVGKYVSARQVIDDNKSDVEKVRFACRISKGRIRTVLMIFSTYCFITD